MRIYGAARSRWRKKVRCFLGRGLRVRSRVSPRECGGRRCPLENDPEGDGVDLHALGLGCRAPGPDREKRYLPHGTVKDLWRTFCTRHSAVACTRRHFNNIFKRDWQDCLRFRQRGQHAECATCVHHKIVLRQLQHDAIGRAREASRWEAHKMAERADRRVYWSIRAEARVSAQYTRPGAIPGVISMIIDGMDQGKFAVPPVPLLRSQKTSKECNGPGCTSTWPCAMAMKSS